MFEAFKKMLKERRQVKIYCRIIDNINKLDLVYLERMISFLGQMVDYASGLYSDKKHKAEQRQN